MNRVSDDDRSTLFSFLALSASQGYAPQSGEIIGILKQLMDEMTEDLAAAQKEEEDRKANQPFGTRCGEGGNCHFDSNDRDKTDPAW